jgi:anti-anti-sigma factor
LTIPLQTAVRHTPRGAVIELNGDVTALTAAAIAAAYRSATEPGDKTIVLNFSGVDHVSSTGIAAVITTLIEARRTGRRLLICGLRPHYARVFERMGLSAFAPVFENEEAALNSTL